MTKKNIFSAQAPGVIGPYSHAIKVGETVYFSGQIPVDPISMNIISNDFREQAVQVFKNIMQISIAAGGSMDAIVKLTIYLTDLTYFSVFNEVMMLYFNPPYPARTTIEVSSLPKNALIEVDAIMVL